MSQIALAAAGIAQAVALFTQLPATLDPQTHERASVDTPRSMPNSGKRPRNLACPCFPKDCPGNRSGRYSPPQIAEKYLAKEKKRRRSSLRRLD